MKKMLVLSVMGLVLSSNPAFAMFYCKAKVGCYCSSDSLRDLQPTSFEDGEGEHDSSRISAEINAYLDANGRCFKNYAVSPMASCFPVEKDRAVFSCRHYPN